MPKTPRKGGKKRLVQQELFPLPPESVLSETNGTEKAPAKKPVAKAGPKKPASKAKGAEVGQRPDPTLATTVDARVTRISADIAATSIPETTSGNHVTNGSRTQSLATKLRAESEPPPRTSHGTAGLTQEQIDILDAARELEQGRQGGQRVLVIGAGAGVGKTFTLKRLEEVLSGRGQYTAFNKSLVEESRQKFTRAAVNTTHSLAFRAVGRLYSHRLNGPRVRSSEIARRLGIVDMDVQTGETGPDGRPRVKRLASSFLAGQVVLAVRRFCQSDDREVGPKHFRPIDGVDVITPEGRDYGNSNKVRDYLLPFARAAWADLSDVHGTLPFNPDCYVKVWQLGQGKDHPVIASDYILLDEAQDTAPVFLDVLRQQTHALLILVGDDNQQIYEWRGACNAMKSFTAARRKLLSQSFRFGQVVADVANSVLAGLDEPTDLVLKGLPAIPSRVCKVQEPRCHLFRTNAGAVSLLMQKMDEGKRGHLIGGTEEVINFCRAALDLQAYRPTQHPELGCFSNWQEVVAYVKEDEGQDLRLMVKLIEEFTAGRIIRALENMPAEAEADLVLSTAHRSKGREWPSVKLGQDFPTANKLTDADRRLVYVAVTRAQEELDLTECPTFCGGNDAGWGEGGRESDWIPGIPVKYTAEMPTPEQLAEYRDGRDRKSAATGLPTSSQGVTAAVVSPPRPAQPPHNGEPVDENEDAAYAWSSDVKLGGRWCVRGPETELGQRVTMRRKDGSNRQAVTLQSLVKRAGKAGEVCFYSVFENDPRYKK